MTNPLLEDRRLPAFSKIRPGDIEPAIDALLKENRERIAQLLVETQAPDWQPGWESLMTPLDEWEDRLNRAWSPVRHLNSVMNTEELRKIHDRCLEKITEYGTELGQNPALYRAVKSLVESRAAEKLDDTQRKALEDSLLDFRLSGVDLPADKKARFKAIQQQLSTLGSGFEQNVLDATLAWSKHFPPGPNLQVPHELKGLPESALAMAWQEALQRQKDGWLLTLQIPCYIAVMTYADNRALRREMYEAYYTRASDGGPHAGRWDNGETIEKILRLRHEAAQLLGFNNYAEKSLATKMAEKPEEVVRFLNELADRAYPQACEEFHKLQAFAANELGGDALMPWDVAYFSEKLRIARYNVSQEELKAWFPAGKVIQGLFDVVNRLYGVDIRVNNDVDVWHPEVTFYDIYDADGQLRGQFYLDLYARQNKRGGAWMDECVNRFRHKKGVQIPVAYLVCNLSPPIGEQPALFTHDEVTTLFHEFGHGLHHMLTRVDYPGVAGINGVEWDAVELPSQFMENWCWEKEALDLISGHYQTGQPLPGEMVDRLRAARNFQAAMQMVRQLEFSLFDFRLHWEYDPSKGSRHQEILQEVREQVAVVKPPEFVRFQHAFSHIFAGGYAAGYYSYKWAEVLSADAFSKFEENGIFDRETGRRFMECILERGGSEKAMDLFVRFRGRAPEIEPLLRQSGLAV
ncbi:MAG TPA: oligopeptidase A [Gammaproteobacteria bacterium]